MPPSPSPAPATPPTAPVARLRNPGELLAALSSKPRGRCGRCRVAVKILRRSRATLSSWVRQSMASQSSTSSGPFTVLVSNLSLGSPGHRPRCSRAHLPTSAPFRARPLGPASGRFPMTTAWSSGVLSWVPLPFGHRRPLLGHPVPPVGFRPSHDRPTGPRHRPGPRRGFRVPRMRDPTGVGAPYTPRPAVFTRPTMGLRPPLAASTSGQALPPGSSSRRSRLRFTRHHQGFTGVHPSGLPLARSLSRTEREPLGFSLELRTPSRQDQPGARRGGDRSRTLIGNYAPGITGLQSARSLNMRDLASHPTSSGSTRGTRCCSSRSAAVPGGGSS